MSLAWVVIAGCALVVYGWGMLTIGRNWPSRAAVDGRFSEAVNQAYDDGWDDCQARHEDLPGPVADDPVGGAADRWAGEMDDAPTVITDARTGAGAWLGQYAELAPDDERPASHTDQFRAIWADLPPADREGLLQWDWKVKSDRALAEFDQWGRDFMADWRADLERRVP